MIRNIRQYCSTVDILLYGTIIQDSGGFVNEKSVKFPANFSGVFGGFCTWRAADFWIRFKFDFDSLLKRGGEMNKRLRLLDLFYCPARTADKGPPLPALCQFPQPTNLTVLWNLPFGAFVQFGFGAIARLCQRH